MSKSYAESILTFPLFHGFTADGASMLLESGRVRELPPGEVLFREGDAPETVVLVLAGGVEVFVQRSGRDLVLMSAAPGIILGELAVLCGMERSASVRATEATAILEWTSTGFRRLLLSNAFLSQRILGQSLRMLVEQERSLIETLMAKEAVK